MRSLVLLSLVAACSGGEFGAMSTDDAHGADHRSDAGAPKIPEVRRNAGTPISPIDRTADASTAPGQEMPQPHCLAAYLAACCSAGGPGLTCSAGDVGCTCAPFPGTPALHTLCLPTPATPFFLGCQ